MDPVLNIIWLFNTYNIVYKTVDFFSDEYKIYQEIENVKRIFQNITCKPNCKELYILSENEDGVSELKKSEWMIVGI